MHDEPDRPHPDGSVAPSASGPAPAGPPEPPASAWSTEHYGFPDAPAAGPATPPVVLPAPGTATGALPARAGSPVVPGARPWWNWGRTLVAAGVAAAIFAVGAVGFTVGHAAADGPRGTDTSDTVGPGPGGPGGRDDRGFGH